MTVRIINADVIEGLRQLPEESVQCVVTSPPYWGLRDYGAAGQIGLEPTMQDHIAKLVEVFRHVRRVMRTDATLWLNYGDAYAGSWGAQSRGEAPGECSALSGGQVYAAPKGTHTGSMKRTPGLKAKDLMMLPERLAIALQDDGWYVRARIIWAKPNPMPESCNDRPTKSHEHIWLMSKQPRYFYDAEAIAEPRNSIGGDFVNGWAAGAGSHDAVSWARDKGDAKSFRGGGKYTKGQEFTNNEVKRETRGNGPAASESRNARDVWTIASAPFPEAHFATFPPALAERCIKAGCPVGGLVLDPFGGAGTTGLAADRLQRNAVLIELNPAYAAMAERRINGDRGALLDLMEAAE